LALPNR